MLAKGFSECKTKAEADEFYAEMCKMYNIPVSDASSATDQKPLLPSPQPPVSS
jgi:hypothetical protein